MVPTIADHLIQGTGHAIHGTDGIKIRATTPPPRAIGVHGFPDLVVSGSPGKDEVIDTLIQTADDLNRIAQTVQRNLSFSVDEPSGRTVIRVVDSATGDTIRQIPSEEALALSAHLKSVLGIDTHGLLIESQA